MPKHLRPSAPSADTPGALIRARREAAGLLQADLANALNCHHSYISRWERGVNTPSPAHAAALAVALGGTLADYLGLGVAK